MNDCLLEIVVSTNRKIGRERKMIMNQEVLKKYRDALDSFLARLKKDKNVIAVYLYGSLNNGDLWENSDIDIFIVINEEKVPFQAFSLIENDIHFHAEVYSRNLYKKNLDTISQGSALYDIFSSGTLLYSEDEKITEYYRNRECLGVADLESQLIMRSFDVLGMMEKAEKALYYKGKTIEASVLIIKLAERLADIEVLLHGDLPKRESIDQAISYNPELFSCIYTDLIKNGINRMKVEEALSLVKAYFEEKTPVIFNVLLHYLKEMDRVVSDSELYRHFEKKLGLKLGFQSMSTLCDWLVEKGMLQKFTSPIRLSSKSRVFVDEAAYLYESGL